MLWRRVLSISISYIILYCLLTNFYIGAPIFPLQLKCKLCWSELTLESQHTPVTRAVFHQIWRIDNIQKQKHSTKMMNLISSFNFCSRPIKSNIGNVSHLQLFFFIALNWNKSMFTWVRSFQPVEIHKEKKYAYRSTITVFESHSPKYLFFLSDIYKLSFSKWSVNVSNFPDDLSPEGWETFRKSFFKSFHLGLKRKKR